MRVQETVSGGWQRRASLPGPDMTLSKLRQCMNGYRLSPKVCGYIVCQGTIKNHRKLQSITCLEKNKYGWRALGQLTKTRLPTAIPLLNAQGKGTLFCLPTGAPRYFFPQQTRSYLKAGTESYLLLVSQYKPLETPAKAQLINKFINFLILFPEHKFLQ